MKIIFIIFILFIIYERFFQKKHTLKSNFPIIGNVRYLFESIGKPFRQYLFLNDREELPYSRKRRNYVYRSAKGVSRYEGFGSDADFFSNEHFIIKHKTLTPKVELKNFEGATNMPCLKVFGKHRKKPYQMPSAINIGGMSYGALGERAVSTLNIGALGANCAQSTGEGGFSQHHNHGADVVYQIGTAYFGCRNEDGRFSLEKLCALVKENPVIKLIEIKLSQGAKPRHAAFLPKEKITDEIAKIRGIKKGVDCESPYYHSEFSSVDEMIGFIEKIADATGLPVGIKSAVGDSEFWMELAEKMEATGTGPDFITIDGGEGGTGAAPPSFADHVAKPIEQGFATVYSTFLKYAPNSLRKTVFIASGKLGFPAYAVKLFALGADAINLSREVLISMGCLQTQNCHKGNCLVGIATHKFWLQFGIDVPNASLRVTRYIETLRKDILELSVACGFSHPAFFNTDNIEKNLSSEGSYKTMNEIHGYFSDKSHLQSDFGLFLQKQKANLKLIAYTSSRLNYFKKWIKKKKLNLKESGY